MSAPMIAKQPEIPAAIAKVPSKPLLASPAPAPMASPIEQTNKLSDIDSKIAAGETDAALELARAGKEDGTPASAAAWARASMAAGGHDEAHQACVAWLSRDKASAGNIDARMTDARALRALGRFDDARARLEEVLKTKPDHAEAKSMLKDLDLMHGKPSPARHMKKKKPTQKLLG